jgi:hypothetical protein
MLAGKGNELGEGRGKRTQQWRRSTKRAGDIQLEPGINTRCMEAVAAVGH